MNQQQDNPSITGLNTNLARLLLEFGRDYERRVIDSLHKLGHSLVRPSHVTVFWNLGMGAVRVTELAERAHVTQQAMGKMLKELERIGYVARDIDGRDRRAKKIRPTARGTELMQCIVEATDEVRGFYADRVSEDALVVLEQQLASCMRRITPQDKPGSWAKPTRVA
jgi:DNA-binding MarR family transcriptional regulator